MGPGSPVCCWFGLLSVGYLLQFLSGSSGVLTGSLGRRVLCTFPPSTDPSLYSGFRFRADPLGKMSLPLGVSFLKQGK